MFWWEKIEGYFPPLSNQTIIPEKSILDNDQWIIHVLGQ